MRKSRISIALAVCLLALLIAVGAHASDLGLNKSNRKVGVAGGVTIAEANGTLTFGYGKLRVDLDAGRLKTADGVETSGAGDLEKVFDETARITQSWQEGISLLSDFLPQADGTMRLRQSAQAPAGGVSGASFTLIVPIKYDLIIPAWNGIRLSQENAAPYMSTMPYPRVWQAQMLLIQAETGGLLIHALDDGAQFKSLSVTSDELYFYVKIETIPQAPFTAYTQFDTVEWAFVPYAGDWQNGAMRYRAFANETFGLDKIDAQKPEWAHDIQLVCMMDMVDKSVVDEIAKYVDPSKTLLQLVNWRQAAYDTDYPNYSVRPALKEGVAYAHSLGFKVSVHANMIGAHLDNADYIAHNLADSASLDARTLEPVIEGYTAFGVDYAFAQINQASTVWQDVLIDQFTKVVEETGIDCVHLDQSLLCFNDGRGLVNGMTSMQGNVELQRRLSEALPGVVFSGEGINEYNMRYASLLQQHVYGLDNGSRSWSETWFNQICPLTTLLFGDYVTFYHYPALPTTQSAHEEYYQAWYRAGNQRAGLIPCLYRENAGDIRNQTETTALVLWDAAFRMENSPVLDTEPWAEDVLLSLKLKDGKTAQWRRDEYGTYFLPDIQNPDEVAVRFISHVEKAKVSGKITNWPLYDGEWIFGLDSKKSYLVSDMPRDLEATHIAAAEKNLTTRSFEETEAYTIVGLKEIVSTSERVVNLLQYGGVMRAGETLLDGTVNLTPEFNSLSNFGYLLPRQGQIRHYNDRIFFHPPWLNEGAGIGHAWLEADIELEEYGKTVFTASPQMGSAVNAALSDGVLYKFMVWEKGVEDSTQMISAQIHVTSELGTPISLDLTPLEGKTVTLRIEAWPYNTTGNDSTAVVAPQIVQTRGQVEQEISYELITARVATDFLSLSGKARITPLAQQRYQVDCPISDTVFFLYDSQPLQGFADLTCEPFVSAWALDSGEHKAVPDGLIPSQLVMEVGEELRNGLLMIPPTDGAVCTHFLFSLPDKPMRFYAALGIKKGADAGNGVTFLVQANGETIASREVLPGNEFLEISVDLSAYAGKNLLLTLAVNANGASTEDYAFWGDPCLEWNQ